MSKQQTFALAAAAATITASPAGDAFPPPAAPAPPAPPAPYDLVTVELDRPRRLKLSWGAMRRIKDQTGFDIRQPKEGAPWDTDTMLPVVLCEALRHEDPEITVEQVEDMIHIGNMAAVVAAFFACVGLDSGAPTAPQQEGAEGEIPLAPAPPTGA